MKRPIRSIYKINEDDTTGFHAMNVVNGVHRQVTGGNDAPPPVDLPELKRSAVNAVNILRGKNNSSGDINIEQSITYNIGNSSSSGGSGAVADGLAFFANHWKEFAIVAGAAAIIAGIAALIKAMNRTVKVRYNKVVKTLQQAQRDFTLKPDGLNMANVMPGVGSRIFDWVARFWTFNFKAKKHITGNIGLYPFCNQYIDEIATDFRTAQDAFSKIKLASDNEKEDDGYSSERETDNTEKKKVGDAETQHESFGIKRYNSFREAFRSDLLNEGVSEENINESALLALSAGITLASFAVKGGAWVVSKMKNGKPVEGSERTVNVTKESTREICYAIINNYADKYVNMQRVFKELGISTDSLADLDESSCDKLQQILEKYAKPEKNAYTKQYGRIKKAYDNMLQHYYKIGDGIITNFVTFTEAKDEKHANLVTASKEKLQNMWDSQKDFYNNNFSHVMIEITSSDAYIGYLNFIIEKVIPVFKTGLAGQADYVLDVMPKSGEYYLLRQTKDQAWLESGEENKGKTAIAKVIDYNEKDNNIKFELIGLVNSDYSIESDGYAEIDGNDIDYSVYKGKNQVKEEGLPYNKWMSLDPVILRWSPQMTSAMFTRTKNVSDKNADQIIYAVGDRSEGEDYKKIVFAEIIDDRVTRKVEIEISFKCNNDEFIKLVCSRTDDETKNMGFTPDWSNYEMSLIVRADGKDEQASNEERVVEIVNENVQKDVKSESILYVKNGKEDDKDVKEYIFAEVLENVESIDHKHELTLNEEGEDEERKDDSSDDNSNDNKSDDANNSNEPETQPAEDNNEPEVVEPGTDAAKNNNITTIVYCTIPADAAVDSEDLTKKINGSFITLSKACSIDEFDQAVNGMGFAKSDDKPNKVKWAIRKAIIKRGHDATIEKDSITDLGAACDEIRERKTGSEELFAKSEEIAKSIYEKTKNIDIAKDFKKSRPQRPGSGFMKNISEYYYTGQDFKGGYYAISTGVKDKGDKEINLYIYPTLVKKDNAKRIDLTDSTNTAELRIYLFVGDDIHQTALNDEKDIKNKIDDIITSLIERRKIDDSRYREIAQTIKSEEGEQQGDYKNQIAADAKSLFGIVGIENGKDASSGVKVDKFVVKQQSSGNVTVKDNNGVINVIFNDMKVGDHPFTFGMKCSEELNKIFITLGNNISAETENSKFTETLISLYEKVIGVNNPQQESISVKCSVSDIVNEGYGKSTKLNMAFSEKLPRGWYIVTEGNYYDTSVKSSKLDESRFFNKISHKDDINKYLKSTDNATMKAFEQYSTTDVYSKFGYQPNGYTPLYESIILVKFDKEGNITDKVQLPKQKIC